MTTRRLSESDIQRLVSDDDTAVYHLSASDRASNLGLVGVAIVKFHDGSAEITDFLMSCRALGRGLEDAIISVVAQDARKRGAEKLVGRFVPTKKNQLSAGFYEKNGFTAQADGETWTVELTPDVLPLPHWVGWQGGAG